MPTTTLSKKYQIVVPKDIRREMRLIAGTKVSLYSLDQERAILVKHPTDHIRAMRGLGKQIWQALGGADRYIKQERTAWDK